MHRFIRTPSSISFSDIVADEKYGLSSSQHKWLVIPNKNLMAVRDFMEHEVSNADLGSEVGTMSYIDQSPYYFIRTKALNSHSFLLEAGRENFLPIMPSDFIDMQLRKGDLILSKDGNIGEIAILEKDYQHHMLSGGLYRLPVKDTYRYYLLAFIKHDLFREQLDVIVPKGATIRHAKTLFLDCKIPLPNTATSTTIKYVSALTKAIVRKEALIRERHQLILSKIEEELITNQTGDKFQYSHPTLSEVAALARLDTGLYNPDFKKWNHIIRHYAGGHVNLQERGFKGIRGSSLEIKSIKTRIDSDTYIEGFYELIIPKHISQYGYVEKTTFIGTPTPLKTVQQGDIIFGGEGFGKGRTFVVIDDVKRTATNYHGIRIVNKNKNLEESIFIRCFLAFARSKGLIDCIGVGGSGGHCAPSYFHLIETPIFPEDKQSLIVQLYHNKNAATLPSQNIEEFERNDESFNQVAGIYELDKSRKRLKQLLDKAIERIINDEQVDCEF